VREIHFFSVRDDHFLAFVLLLLERGKAGFERKAPEREPILIGLPKKETPGFVVAEA